MKNKKLSCLLSLALVCMVFVCGCQSEGKTNGNSATPTIEVNDTKVSNMQSKDTSNDATPLVELNTIKELSIYSIDGETAQKVSVTAVVSSQKEITPQLIVDKVVESMADETFMIGIDSVTTEEDRIIVSFLDDQPPVTNVGSSVEGEILDAIAMSLIDNLSDYHKVIFRVMGEGYSSGHIEFDKDYVYLESN